MEKSLFTSHRKSSSNNSFNHRQDYLLKISKSDPNIALTLKDSSFKTKKNNAITTNDFIVKEANNLKVSKIRQKCLKNRLKNLGNENSYQEFVSNKQSFSNGYKKFLSHRKPSDTIVEKNVLHQSNRSVYIPGQKNLTSINTNKHLSFTAHENNKISIDNSNIQSKTALFLNNNKKEADLLRRGSKSPKLYNPVNEGVFKNCVINYLKRLEAEKVAQNKPDPNANFDQKALIKRNLCLNYQIPKSSKFIDKYEGSCTNSSLLPKTGTNTHSNNFLDPNFTKMSKEIRTEGDIGFSETILKGDSLQEHTFPIKKNHCNNLENSKKDTEQSKLTSENSDLKQIGKNTTKSKINHSMINLYYDKEFLDNLQRLKLQNSESILKNSGNFLISKLGILRKHKKNSSSLGQNQIGRSITSVVPCNILKNVADDEVKKNKTFKESEKLSNQTANTAKIQKRFIKSVKSKKELNYRKEFKNVMENIDVHQNSPLLANKKDLKKGLVTFGNVPENFQSLFGKKQSILESNSLDTIEEQVKNHKENDKKSQNSKEKQEAQNSYASADSEPDFYINDKFQKNPKKKKKNFPKFETALTTINTHQMLTQFQDKKTTNYSPEHNLEKSIIENSNKVNVNKNQPSFSEISKIEKKSKPSKTATMRLDTKEMRYESTFGKKLI